MPSQFVNKFKQTDPDELRAFQSRVLAVLRDIYPDRQFSRNEDAHSIDSGGAKLGLTNIRSHFLLTTQTESDLRTIVAEHFGGVWSDPDLSDRTGLNWERVESLVLPQLMPADFLQKLELASFEFGGGVVTGMVIDSEKAYSYVTQADLDRWGKTLDEVYAIAVDNLENRSRDLETVAIPGQLIVVNTMDSFDAARILVPTLRVKFAEFLGSPFNFGVPNRDFLICWSRSADSEFQASMRSQIATDSQERPYPLSGNSFEVTQEGEIRILDEPTRLENAQNAEMN